MFCNIINYLYENRFINIDFLNFMLVLNKKIYFHIKKIKKEKYYNISNQIHEYQIMNKYLLNMDSIKHNILNIDNILKNELIIKELPNEYIFFLYSCKKNINYSLIIKEKNINIYDEKYILEQIEKNKGKKFRYTGLLTKNSYSYDFSLISFLNHSDSKDIFFISNMGGFYSFDVIYNQNKYSNLTKDKVKTIDFGTVIKFLFI